MTGPQQVRMVLPCPLCGADAEWVGRRVSGDDTSYEVLCDRCDRTWTVGAQVERRRGHVA